LRLTETNSLKTLLIAGTVGLMGASVAATSWADDDDDAGAAAFIQTTAFTVSDAALMAETETGGIAMGVELENEGGTWIYEVETALADGTLYEVELDATTGMVIASGIDTDADDDDDTSAGTLTGLSAAQTTQVIRNARARCRTFDTKRQKRNCRRRHGLR